MIRVTHYSDVLCVWAYISQIRLDELESNFGNDVTVEHRFMPVFGDVAGKIQAQWQDRGGLRGYTEHVREVASAFDHIEIADNVWVHNTPTSSLPAHLMLCSVKALHAADSAHTPADAVRNLLRAIRHAFFVETRDVSQHHQLLKIADAVGIAIDDLQEVMDDGRAHACLAADIATAQDKGVRASPTLMLNDGRQVLAGNVGYRVIEANIRELLKSPDDQQTWC